MTQSLSHPSSTYSTTEETFTLGSLPGPHGCYRTAVPPVHQPVLGGPISESCTTTAGCTFYEPHQPSLTGHAETKVPPSSPIAITATTRSVTGDTHPNPPLFVTTPPTSASVNDTDDTDSGDVPSMYFDCVASDAGSLPSLEQTFYDTVSSHPVNSTPGSPSRDRYCPVSTVNADNSGQGLVSSTVVYVSTRIKTSEEGSVVGRRHSHTETGGSLLPRKAAGALRELLQTEDRFVKAMKDFIQGYLYSVRFTRQATGNDLLQHLLHHLVPLVDFHAEFYKRLANLLKIPSDGQSVERITTADLQKVVDLFTTSETEFNVYLPYCTVIRNFSSEAKILEKSQEWLRFTKLAQRVPSGSVYPRRTSRLSLQEFLMRPIQRLCLYPLLLKEVVKHLPLPYHSLRADLDAAVEMIRSLTVGINEARRTQEVHYQTQQLYHRYEDTPRLPLSFLRRLGDIVLAGALEVLAYDTPPLRIKYYACIMLPGFLLIMKTKSATVYEPKYWFPMETMLLTDLAQDASLVARHTNSLPSVTASRPSPYSRTLSWRLIHEGTQKCFDFFAACPEEKELWWKHLHQATLTASKQNSGYRYCSCIRTRTPTSMVSNGPVRRPSMTPSSLWPLHSLRWGSSLGAHCSVLDTPISTDPRSVPSVEFSALSSSPQAASLYASLDLTDVPHFPSVGSAVQQPMSSSTSTLYHPGSSRKSLVDSRFGDMFTHDCLRSRAKALAALGATGVGVSIHNLPVALPPTPVSSAPSTPLCATAPSPKWTANEGPTQTQPPWIPLGTAKDEPQSRTEEVVKNRRAASDGAMIKRRQTALANQRQAAGRGAERSRSSLATFRHRPLLSQPRQKQQRTVAGKQANETVDGIGPQTHTEQERTVSAPGLLLGRNNGGNRSQRLIHILG
ncbi:hypothetical protein IWQ61_003637, partial [Dispira simplex]